MRNRALSPSLLYELVPSAHDDEPIGRARALFTGLAGVGGMTFEVAIADDGVRFFVRTSSADTADALLGQLRAASPEATIRQLGATGPHRDPLAVEPHERVVTVDLVPLSDSAFPLDVDPRHGDPFIGVLAAAIGERRPGERVICQLAVGKSPGSRWVTRVRARTAGPERVGRTGSPTASATELLPLVGIGLAGLLGMRFVGWYRGGDWLAMLASAGGALVALPVVGVLAARFLVGRRPLPTTLADEKLAYPLFTARLRVIAISSRADASTHLHQLVDRVADAYEGFDHPAGNGVRAGSNRLRRLWPPRRLVLNTAELAALWHFPPTAEGLPLAEQPLARRRMPPADVVARGCRVGVSRHQGRSIPVHLPRAALFRNHLVVAKTRRGKSTLLQHIARHLMDDLDQGREKVLLVVIDPHQDLAESVLGIVPAGLTGRTVYLDFTDRERPIGLNLLDVALFPSRDRTAENIVAMLHRLWPDNWGPRMEGALRAALLCLHQANQVRRRDEQYTLLDVVALLSSPAFRERVMTQVPDPALHAWWRDNYDHLGRPFQQQIANPVTTKVGRFQVTEAARLVLGQRVSTIDPRALLREGGVLVVNSATGLLGEGGAALIGATVLNLLTLVVEEQVSLPAGQRSRLVALVDESSTLGGADYPRMLSELGKYGASFVLVTQSLAKLDAIDRALRPTLFANIDSLTVFQVSAEDARYLAPELGGDLEVSDLVSLDDYTCYARWSSQGIRHAAFSVYIDPPLPLDADRVHAIAEASALRFGRPRRQPADHAGPGLGDWSLGLNADADGGLIFQPLRNQHRDRR